MITLKIKAIEKALNKKLLYDFTVLGIDTASRTGWAVVKTTKTKLTIDYGYIDTRGQEEYFRYNRFVDFFKNLLTDEFESVIIEDVFFGKNVKTLKLLARIGMIAYVISRLKGIANVRFIIATRARHLLGFNGRAKKHEIHKEFREKLDINIEDEDIVDAIVLALNGVLKNI